MNGCESWIIKKDHKCKFWEIVKDREAWNAIVHRVAKSLTWLSNWTTATTNVWGLQFLHILTSPALIIIPVCDYSHPNGYRVVSQVIFICISLLVMLNICSCAYWPFVCLLWRNVYSNSSPAFEMSCDFLIYFRGPLYILDINLLIRYVICKYFLQFSQLPFYSVDSVAQKF